MSPKKSTKPIDGFESEACRTGLLVVSLSLLLLLAPIVYRLTTRLIEEDYDHRINSSPVALIVTFIFGAAFMLISNSYIKHVSHHAIQEYQQQIQSFHQQSRTAFFYKLFPVFAGTSQPSNNQANDKASSSFYSLSSQEQGNSDSNSRRKIDPKYFKPKFIIDELITFWDTTCTVITWGSFYVIGGTIVATEKITQKIKSKSKSPYSGESNPPMFGTNNNNNRNSNRGTGQSDFSFGSAFGSTSQTNSTECNPQQTSQTYRKISSWTKRSINSIKKKYSRAVRSNAPQLTSGPANDSSSHIFFFVSPNASAAA